jgi:hypothetical protein
LETLRLAIDRLALELDARQAARTNRLERVGEVLYLDGANRTLKNRIRLDSGLQLYFLGHAGLETADWADGQFGSRFLSHERSVRSKKELLATGKA